MFASPDFTPTGLPTFYEIINNAGQAANVQLCVDAAARASYPGSTKWNDLTVNGEDFFLGTTGTGAAVPTFNGVIGALTGSEYFSVNGSQYVTYDSANETWMQAMHKAAANWGFCAIAYNVGGATLSLFGTGGQSATNTGVQFYEESVGVGPVITCTRNGFALNVTADTVVPSAAWCFIAVRINEAGGATASFQYLNGAYNKVSGSDTFNGAYSSPSSGNSTFTLQMLAEGGNLIPSKSGSRMAGAAFWSGGAPTKAGFDSIYAGLKAARPGYSLP